MKTLHILNGDATRYIFEQTNIGGDQLVWREILSDGPVSKENLWALRSEWIAKNFGENPQNYHQKVIDEADRLKNLSKYNQVVLWFEYDLVCQINLIFILSELQKTYTDQFSIYLICPEKVAGMPNFKGLGELNSTQLFNLYPTKVRLQKADLDFAAKAWEVYINNDVDEISTFLAQNFGNLPLFKKALKAHLLRHSNPSTQLNFIEEKLLEIIKNGTHSKQEIYEIFSEKAPIFGMGDQQIELVLKQLKEKKLIEI